MDLWVGTSGYSYKEWKGTFYPTDIPSSRILGYYGERLTAVEIDNTFYRLPRASVLSNWATQVPGHFRFALKASRRITHFKRLKGAEDETGYLLRTAASLGERLGAILFQLPPNLPKDIDRLERFLDILDGATRAAIEFRHPTWFEEDVMDLLRTRGVALCGVDAEEELDAGQEALSSSTVAPPAGSPAAGSGTAGSPAAGSRTARSFRTGSTLASLPLARTADWGYLRLRRPGYTEADLAAWHERIAAQGWREAFVFFKHEDAGIGPRLAMSFLERTRSAAAR